MSQRIAVGTQDFVTFCWCRHVPYESSLPANSCNSCSKQNYEPHHLTDFVVWYFLYLVIFQVFQICYSRNTALGGLHLQCVRFVLYSHTVLSNGFIGKYSTLVSSFLFSFGFTLFRKFLHTYRCYETNSPAALLQLCACAILSIKLEHYEQRSELLDSGSAAHIRDIILAQVPTWESVFSFSLSVGRWN